LQTVAVIAITKFGSEKKMQITLSHKNFDGSWQEDFTCDSLDQKLTAKVREYNLNDIEWTVREEK